MLVSALHEKGVIQVTMRHGEEGKKLTRGGIEPPATALKVLRSAN